MAGRVDVGDIAEIGFTFRDNNGVLVSPTELTIQVRLPDGSVVTPPFDETDPEVTLDATLGSVLAADLGLTAAENAAGVGIVRLLYQVTISGIYRFYALTSVPFISAESERVPVRPIWSTIEGTIEGNCQDPTPELIDCGTPCRPCEMNDRIYQAAWATLTAAGEALTVCGIDEPCTRWIEIGSPAAISPIGECGCEALVVVINDRILAVGADPRGSSVDRLLRVDVVISHQYPVAVDPQGTPTTMPNPGDEAGAECATLNGLALRMMREAEALDRLLGDRLACHLDRCRSVATINERWTSDGACRRYTRTVEIQL